VKIDNDRDDIENDRYDWLKDTFKNEAVGIVLTIFITHEGTAAQLGNGWPRLIPSLPGHSTLCMI
jgi:hypothetical protein